MFGKREEMVLRAERNQEENFISNKLRGIYKLVYLVKCSSSNPLRLMLAKGTFFNLINVFYSCPWFVMFMFF